MEQRLTQDESNNIITEPLFKFSIRCLNKYMKIKPTNNYAFNPYNLYEALFSVYLTSSGDIEQILKRVLYLTNILKADLIDIVNFDKYSSNLIGLESKENACNYENGSMCLIKESQFFANPLQMKKLFKNGFTYFNGNIMESLYKLNRKIRWQTKNYICDPVQLSMTYKNLQIVLTSVFRFNRGFETTRQSDVQDESIDFVELKRRNFFCNELSTLVSELPYENSNLSLFMLLPASQVSDKLKSIKVRLNNSYLRKLIKQLSTDEGTRTLRNLLHSDTNNIKKFSFLPNFKLERNIKIRELLQVLGVPQLLKSDAIELDESFFPRHKQSVRYGDIVHRTRVKITKKNTIMGAMTLLSRRDSVSKMVSKSAKVDTQYPFLWLLYDRLQGNILFMGVCRRSSLWSSKYPLKTYDSKLSSEASESEMFSKRLLEIDL